MFLLSRLAMSTPIWLAALYMLVLGLGLGLVMQVLVLAAQNAVPYEHARRRHLRLDALPPDRRLDRRLDLRRDLRQPARDRTRRPATPRRSRPGGGEPAVVQHLPRRSGSRTSKPSRPRSSRSSSPRPDSRSPRSCSPGCCARCRSARPPPRKGSARVSPPRARTARPRARTDHQLDCERTHADGHLPRIVDASALDLTPAEAWLLGRIATVGPIERPRSPRTPARGGRAADREPAPARLSDSRSLEGDRIELSERRRERTQPRRSGPRRAHPRSPPT